MALRTKTKAITEFGDFQTPPSLAIACTQLLRDLGVRPRSILEPTCGCGSFLAAAHEFFPDAVLVMGVEKNPAYVIEAKNQIKGASGASRVKVHEGDFFEFDWESVFTANAGPWLVIGNPPWVTSSALASLDSDNLPAKSNFQGRAGIEAVTGKSNFDISEWMLLKYLGWLKNKGTIAVLCKTAVARKVLLQAWKEEIAASSRIYKINAQTHFGAAVDACLFILEMSPNAVSKSCLVFDGLDAKNPSGNINFCNGHLVSGAIEESYLNALWGPEKEYAWRSGVKHDCSRVMEIFKSSDGYENGLGECVEIETEYIFPMLKGSDIGNGRIVSRGAMILPQKAVGQETTKLKIIAPKTWSYLSRHSALLDKRGSIIYRNKPQFSIFGVGPYTFAPWKLAVCGMYKNLRFVIVGPIAERPVVFDDTVYFLPCWSEEEALFIRELLHSSEAQAFFSSMIHWSDKRPITVDLLKRLSLRKLAHLLGRETEFDRFVSSNGCIQEIQPLLFAS